MFKYVVVIVLIYTPYVRRYVRTYIYGSFNKIKIKIKIVNLKQKAISSILKNFTELFFIDSDWKVIKLKMEIKKNAIKMFV